MGILACKSSTIFYSWKPNSGLIWKDAQNQSATGEVCLAEIPYRKLHSKHSRHQHLKPSPFLRLVSTGGRAGSGLPVLGSFFGTATQLDHSRINTQVIWVLLSFSLKETKFISWWSVPLRDNSHCTMKIVVSPKIAFKRYNMHLGYNFNNGNRGRLLSRSLTKNQGLNSSIYK